MTNKLLFMEDLYDFYANKYKRSTHFSAEKTGEPIVVQAKGLIKFDSDNKNTEGLMPVHLQACHIDRNINNSSIQRQVMEKALPSFSNRPILGYIHEVELDNGEKEWNFYTHNMHEDENGELVYDEIPVGIVPESCNAKLVYDENKNNTYVEVDGYIFEEYSKASEILQREGECFCSVELSIRELSYQAKERYLEIEDFFFSGVTILGKTPEGDLVQPGMQGSNIKLADFSAENNSVLTNYQSQMIEFQARLEKLESACFNKDQDGQNTSLKEGGNQLSKFEELLAKYNVTLEDITFEYEGVSDEELEQKFAELFEDNSDGEEPTTDGEGEPSEDGTTEDEPTTDGENKGDEGSEPEGDGDSNFSVRKEELFNQLFEISFDEIHYALNALCSIYRNDSEWCYVSQVYEDYFIMEDWDSNKYYKQSYTKDGDNIALSGERIEMFAMMLTESEKISIEEMRSNYSALVEFKETVEKNELHSQKEALLSDEKYSILADVEAFATLKKEMDNYSLTDLEKEAKVIYADHVSAMQTFSAKEKPVSAVKVLTNVNGNKSKKSRYGSLFSK